MHIDNYLAFYKDKKVFKKLIASLKDTFNLPDKGNLVAYLSTKIKNR